VVMLLLVCAIGGAAFWLYTQRASSAPQLASLAVTSAPAGAAVFLDDVHTGQKTPAVLQDLALGRQYRVSVGLPNQVGARPGQHFRFDRGGPHAYHFEIGPGKEALQVVSEPSGCDVLVDGELRGQAPLELHLARGRKHAIELRKRGYQAKLVQHYAERDKDTLRLELEAEPARTVKRVLPVRVPKPGAAAGETGTLEIRSDLKGQVFIDDRPAGRTPGFRQALAAGTYRVMVVPDGAKIRHAATIAVVAGKTHQLTLTPSPTP